MRILGLLLILFGLWLCFTILFAGAGATAIGLGALLCIAGWHSTPGRVSKAIQITLGALITVSVVWAGIAFIGLAAGVKPTPRVTPIAAQQTQHAPAALPEKHSAKRHATAR